MSSGAESGRKTGRRPDETSRVFETREVLQGNRISTMVRTRLQLPDDVHKRARRLADARGISMSELVRRGLELILSQDQVPNKAQAEWQLPAPRHLGWKGLSDAKIKDLARTSDDG